MKYYRDLKNSLDTAFDEGVEIGREEGREKGRKEGKSEQRKLIALNLIKAGLDNYFISNTIGLTEKDIEKLRNS